MAGGRPAKGPKIINNLPEEPITEHQEGQPILKNGSKKCTPNDDRNPPQKKPCQQHTVENLVGRDPLPKRLGRNEDPTGRRSKQAHAAANRAAKAEKALQMQQSKQAEEDAREALANIEVDESFYQKNKCQQRIRHQSELEDLPANDGSEGSKEFIPIDKVSSPSEDDSDSIKSQGNTGMTQGCKGWKPTTKAGAKPGLQDGITMKKNEVKNRRGISELKGGGNGPPVASGFNSTWLDATEKSTRQKEMMALDDDAALSTRPNFPPSPINFDHRKANAKIANATRRNATRKNILVARVTPENEDIDTVFPLIPQQTTHHAPKTMIKPSHTSTEGLDDVPLPPQAPKSQGQGNLINTGVVVNRTSAFMLKGGNKLNLLPSLILSETNRYFATLFKALFASQCPFDDFKKTLASFLSTSLTAFAHVWPNLDYQLEADDMLFNIGYQRVLEKRGKIHEFIKADLERYFKMKLWTAAEITNWVDWFRGTWGSPVFYETPIPQDGVWCRDAPGYMNPHGFLKSSFLIRAGSRFLQDAEIMAFDFGPPRGLFVLILTAYEKVVRSYGTGEYVPKGDFDAKSCGIWVKQYNKNFDGKSVEWWNKILSLYDLDHASKEGNNGADMSILDEGRGALPMSSP